METKEKIYRRNVPYVLHYHEAKRAGTHMDFRLKNLSGNYLDSWALVANRLPKRKGEKVLAIRTLPHKMKWTRYQGIIPDGKHGAGKISILQNGTCTIIGYSDKYITFTVEGKYLNGRYALIKMQSNKYKRHKQEEWMLVNITPIEKKEEFVSERFLYKCQ